MTRLTLIAAAAALMTMPIHAQSTTETAVEILNEGADSEDEVIEGAEPVDGAVDCANPAVENENESTDMESELEECVTVADGEVEAGAEILEDLEEEDDGDDVD